MRLRSFEEGNPEFASFERIASKLYAADPFYLKKDAHFPKNTELWLVDSEDAILARCGSFTRADLPKALFLGWYESVEGHAGSMMLRSLCDIAKERGYNRVIGPMNGSTWHQYRLAVPSGRTFLGDVYHKSWYQEQFTDAEFKPIATYHSSLSKLRGKSAVSNARLRDLDLDRFAEELRTAYDLSIASFEYNLFYSPISFEEFSVMYTELRAIVDPRLVKFALDDIGKEIGFLFAIPDLFEKPSKTIVMKTIAVHPDHRGKGLMSALANGVMSSAVSSGYTSAIYALYEASNLSGKLAHGGELIRTYHIYERKL